MSFRSSESTHSLISLKKRKEPLEYLFSVPQEDWNKELTAFLQKTQHENDPNLNNEKDPKLLKAEHYDIPELETLP